MMKKYVILLILFSSTIFSCQSDEGRLVGLWERSPNSDWWIQFNNDNTFDYGWQSNLKFTGNYDLDNNIINLRSNDKRFGSKKYQYTLENNTLTLIKLNGEVDLIYNRRLE